MYFKLEKEDEAKVDGLYKLNADGEYEDYDESNPDYVGKEAK